MSRVSTWHCKPSIYLKRANDVIFGNVYLGDMFAEKTPIPGADPWEGSGSGGSGRAASPPRDLLLDRVYSDSDEEREYQVTTLLLFN